MTPTLASHVVRLALPTLLALAACQSKQSQTPAPPPKDGLRAEISNEFTATAQVVAVDPAQRLVTLRRADGTAFDVLAGEGVRNFDRIKAGDELRVRYKEVLAAARLSPGDAAKPAQAGFMAVRAKEGDKPAAGVGASVGVRVRIESVDTQRWIVVFSLPSGELIARRIQTPQGREFAAKLAVGDAVQLGYVEVLALEVDEIK